MGRCTDLLTLYFPQPCLKNKEVYAEIRRVVSHRRERLSWSKGNVNLTDYWYTMVDAFMEQDIAYTCQHIDLLSDNEAMWWQEQIESGRSWVCLSFIKWKKESEEGKKKEEELKCDGKEHRFYRTFGNADCIYAFSAENRTELMDKLEGLRKNRQLFFSIYSFFGQCSFSGKEKWRITLCEIVDGSGLEKNELCGLEWCNNIIDGLRTDIKKCRNKKNKKMVAYYQALGQIVNIVAQYEQSPVFKDDLFYMFYPPISLFLTQLKTAEDELSIIQDKITEYSGTEMEIRFLAAEMNDRMRKVEFSMSEFIDSMETLLYHMGHSCRDILSDAGRSGIPYDIPVHLCLMYIAYLHVFTAIINDRNYRFEYCLVPLAYSRPVTRYFDFGLAPTGRLIRVQISRHMMFMPRSLLIILAHEVSHYVSESPRNRELRARCCVDITNTAMVLRLIPDDILEDMDLEGKEYSLLQEYLKSMQGRLYKYFNINVWKRCDTQNTEDYKYHFSNFLGNLEQTCREILMDEEQLLGWNLEFVDKEILKSLRESEKLLQNILFIQRDIRQRQMVLWDDSVLGHFLEGMYTNLRECYADILAVSVLDISWREFIEAYIISESYVPDEHSLAPELVNRYAMVKYLMEEDKRKGWEKLTLTGLEKSTGVNEMDKFLWVLEKQVNEYLDDYRQKNADFDKTCSAQKKDSGKNNSVPKGGESLNYGYKPATHTDLFYYREIIDMEIKYLTKCYSDIKQMLSGKGNNSVEGQIDLVRTVYKHFLVKEQGKDSSYEEFFMDYNELINYYKEDVKKFYNSEKDHNTVNMSIGCL